jgi:hypothetical protein
MSIDKRTKKYKNINNRIDKFLELCEEKKILARRDWSDCNTCGNAEIETERKEIEAKYPLQQYIAYVFYHGQEADRIKEVIKDNNYMACDIYLNWGYFDEKKESKDPDGKKLAEIIHKIAIDNGYELDYSDIYQKLLLHIDIK